MKKSFLTITLVLLSLTTVAQAQIVASEDRELIEGKMEASAFGHLKTMNDEFDSISKQIMAMQNDNADDENGLIGNLGQLLHEVNAQKNEFLEISAEMQQQSGDELFKTYSKALKSLSGAREQLAKAKLLVIK